MQGVRGRLTGPGGPGEVVPGGRGGGDRDGFGVAHLFDRGGFGGATRPGPGSFPGP